MYVCLIGYGLGLYVCGFLIGYGAIQCVCVCCVLRVFKSECVVEKMCVFRNHKNTPPS